MSENTEILDALFQDLSVLIERIAGFPEVSWHECSEVTFSEDLYRCTFRMGLIETKEAWRLLHFLTIQFRSEEMLDNVIIQPRNRTLYLMPRIQRKVGEDTEETLFFEFSLFFRDPHTIQNVTLSFEDGYLEKPKQLRRITAPRYIYHRLNRRYMIYPPISGTFVE